MADRQISPGNALPPPRLCPPHIRSCYPYRYWTLETFDSSSSMNASYAIPVRQASALPAASFRFHLTMDTLAVRLTVPPAGSVEDFNLQVGAPCRAHKEERDGNQPSPILCFIFIIAPRVLKNFPPRFQRKLPLAYFFHFFLLQFQLIPVLSPFPQPVS